MLAADHEPYMRRALEVAQCVWGTTHPNPMVGAIIVEDGRVVAEGATAPDGGPHAEKRALQARGIKPQPGATLYVTLEPCSTHGRTGACTDLIIAAGVKRVVVGATDPNPAHTGRGFEILRAAGVEVITGVLQAECADLNLIFNHWITRGTPLLAAKMAVTLDGKTACRTGESKWITNEQSRADVHRWRRLFPGIAVGAMTVLKDNPRLTSRRAGEPEWCPRRFVFDGLLRTLEAKEQPTLFTDEFSAQTTMVTSQHAGPDNLRELEQRGINAWCLESPTPRVGFAAFRKRCAEERVAGVFFEGGTGLLSGLLGERELDYLFAYRAPLLFADHDAYSMFGGMQPKNPGQAVKLGDVRHASLGDDQLMRGRVLYPGNPH